MEYIQFENYYNEMINFKKYFIDHCMVNKKYETHKVWAQWLIRNLCRNNINYHLIPDQQVNHDVDLFNHLKEKNVNIDEIPQFYKQITTKISELYQKFNDMKITQFHDHVKIVEMSQLIDQEVTNKHGKRFYIYRFGQIYVKYESHVHEKLLSRYNGDVLCSKFCLFELGFNYYILDGHSFQWCVPLKAFHILEKYLPINAELFASPINFYSRNYYSLFFVDTFFGAVDNFFNIKTLNLSEGIFEVNPPFIEQILIESSRIILNALHYSQEHAHDLLFIYIMPDWLDSLGYQMLTNSGYLIDEIILTEKNHFYYQSSNRKMVLATFETHVLLIGTSSAKNRWTVEIKNKFIENFTHY